MDYQVEQLPKFREWLKGMKDLTGKAAILSRVDRVKLGNFGDHKSVGGNISELRVKFGKGYRVYYTIREEKIVFLLCGGDKSTQSKDIALAQQLAKEQ
jgi:putative addiction module killer protein